MEYLHRKKHEKIFLASYFAKVVEQFKAFVQNNEIKTKRILFIPTASNVEEYTEYVTEGKQALEKLGYVVDKFDIANEPVDVAANKVKNAEMFFITDGNTFYLLQELKKKNLVSLINEKVDSGTPYIGESAGAMIMAPSFEYCRIVNNATLAKDLTDYSALNQTKFYTLPHYKEEPFVELDDEVLAVYKDKLNLLPINNNQVIIVNDKDYKIV